MVKNDESMFCYYLRKSVEGRSRCACRAEAETAGPAVTVAAAVPRARAPASRHPGRPQVRGGN